MMNFTEEEVVDLRDRLSREKAVELIPISLYVLVLMIIGLIGNVLVWVFYSRKSRITPTSRLIIAVAVIDTIICILMPKNIVDISLSYKFTSSALCKLNNFVNHTTAVSSVMVLVAIATFRFRAVCRPFGRQFSLRHANISIVIAVVFSVLVSVPVLITHESVPINITVTSGTKIIGYDCNTSKKPSLKGLNLAVNVIHFFILVSTTITFVVLYGKMGYNILKYYKTKKVLTGKASPRIKALRSDVYTDSSDSRAHETTTESISNHGVDKDRELTEASDISYNANCEKVNVKDPIKDMHQEGPDNNTEHSIYSSKSNEVRSDKVRTDDICFRDREILSSGNEHYTKTHPQELCKLPNIKDNEIENPNMKKFKIDTHDPDKDKHGHDNTPGKVDTADDYNISTVAVKQTVMLCIITVIFVCSFLPYIIMNLSRTLSKNKDNDDDFTNWIQFCTRSYLINSAANPFVYGLFNTEFRHFAKRMLCRCCGR